MPAKEIFSILSIFAAFLAALPYVRSIIRKETRPNLFSWLIWGLSCAIGGAVQLAEGGGWGSWLMIMNAVYCLGIAFWSLWIGTRDIKKIDGVVMMVTLSAIPLWLITKNPLWSVLIIIMIDGMGYGPTIRKSWNRPYEEAALSWGLSCVFFILSIMALEKYKLTTYLYPATFAAVNTGFVLFLLMRRHMLKQIDADH